MLTGLLALSGCAYLKSTTSRTTTLTTNGIPVVTETTTAKGYTLFDGNASLVKFRNQSGYSGGTNGGWAPGTYASGVNESSNTTNLVNIIGAVAEGIVKGLK